MNIKTEVHVVTAVLEMVERPVECSGRTLGYVFSYSVRKYLLSNSFHIYIIN